MGRFEKFLEACDGTGKKKRKRQGKMEDGMNESYMAGKGGDVGELVNVLIGWPKDIKVMVDNNNISGALQSLKVFKTKVIPDLEKALKNKGK